MTEAQQKQYDRFIAAGFDPDDAARLVELGAWLGTQDVSEQAVIDIERYRRERDARRRESRRYGEPEIAILRACACCRRVVAPETARRAL